MADMLQSNHNHVIDQSIGLQIYTGLQDCSVVQNLELMRLNGSGGRVLGRPGSN
jgi:hypothetical protein